MGLDRLLFDVCTLLCFACARRVLYNRGRLESFRLLGTEKVGGINMFPSDHFGVSLQIQLQNE